MSLIAARSFVDRVKSDGEFRAALAAKPDKNARKQLATEAGYDFTMEELESIRAEYSDDDLGEVLFQESQDSYDSALGHGGN